MKNVRCLQLLSSIVKESPKSVKKWQQELSLEKAREEKRRWSAGKGSIEVVESDEALHAMKTVEVHDMTDHLHASVDELDMYNEDIHPPLT